MENFGDLMLQVKRDPDKILSLNGIGPKAMEEIQTLVQTYQFPSLETVPEPVAEEAPALEESATAAVVEGGAEAVVATVEAEAVEAPAVENSRNTGIVENLQMMKRALRFIQVGIFAPRRKSPRNLYRMTKTAFARNRTRRAKARKKRVILWSTILIRRRKCSLQAQKVGLDDWTEIGRQDLLAQADKGGR
jgi:hypothetical protein